MVLLRYKPVAVKVLDACTVVAVTAEKEGELLVPKFWFIVYAVMFDAVPLMFV